MDLVGSRLAESGPALPNPTAGGTVMVVDTPHPASSLPGRGNWLRDAGFLVLQVVLVYVCAISTFPWLGRWFAWVVEPSNSIAPSDWFLRHLEVVCILPALALGYALVQANSLAVWTGVVPTLVLGYRLISFSGLQHSSVLYASAPTTGSFRYFFDVRQALLWGAGDPVRVLAQMTVTAPFYAGIGYSLGALCGKHEVLKKIFSLERPSDEGSEAESPAADAASHDHDTSC